VSWPVAHRAYVAGQLAQPLPAVSVLGIDETRRGKPKWEHDEATGRWRIAHDRWHTAIVDAEGTAGLLAHIDGRTAARVAQRGAVPQVQALQ
jgi:transposase